MDLNRCPKKEPGFSKTRAKANVLRTLSMLVQRLETCLKVVQPATAGRRTRDRETAGVGDSGSCRTSLRGARNVPEAMERGASGVGWCRSSKGWSSFRQASTSPRQKQTGTVRPRKGRKREKKKAPPALRPGVLAMEHMAESWVDRERFRSVPSTLDQLPLNRGASPSAGSES